MRLIQKLKIIITMRTRKQSRAPRDTRQDNLHFHSLHSHCTGFLLRHLIHFQIKNGTGNFNDAFESHPSPAMLAQEHEGFRLPEELPFLFGFNYTSHYNICSGNTWPFVKKRRCEFLLTVSFPSLHNSTVSALFQAIHHVSWLYCSQVIPCYGVKGYISPMYLI